MLEFGDAVTLERTLRAGWKHGRWLCSWEARHANAAPIGFLKGLRLEQSRLFLLEQTFSVAIYLPNILRVAEIFSANL